METVTQRIAPTSAISDSKYGKTKATTTVLTNSNDLMSIPMGLLFHLLGKFISMASAIGEIISAYLTSGAAKVVYIAIFELILLVDMFSVT